MSKKELVFLYLFSVAFYMVFASLQKAPGYMDAEYYFCQSLALASGQGWTENFIWNYLNNPVAIPVPAFGFWMPLTSLLGSLGLFLMKSVSFFAARVPFILLAGVIPVLAASLATKLSHHRFAGWLSASLALCSGMFLPYITITDTFTPYMVLGGLVFVICLKIQNQKSTKTVIFLHLFLGSIIGLMALTRSDGLFWLFGALFFILATKDGTSRGRRILHFFFVVIGFLIIMVPWYVHNVHIYDSILPPGNSAMLWLNSYDDLFIFPANLVSIESWAKTGILTILKDRLTATTENLQTLAVIAGSIFLIPFMALGWWKKRRDILVRTGFVMILVLLFVMSIIFPYAGERGGFFHALAGTQVFLWAFVPVGLEEIILWAQKHRNWQVERAWKMFAPTLVSVAFVFSIFIFSSKLAKGAEGAAPWNSSLELYNRIEASFSGHKGSSTGFVMVNDPPGYTLATGRPAVMIPTGGLEAIQSVADKFGVKYLIVDDERKQIQRIIRESYLLDGNLKLISEIEGAEIYEFVR